LSKGDNLNTTFWERKGEHHHKLCAGVPPPHVWNSPTVSPLPRFNYIAGSSTLLPMHFPVIFTSPHLTLPAVMSNLSTLLPQNTGYQVRPALGSAIISALRKRQCPKESLLVVPTPPLPSGNSGSLSQVSWASTPFSKPSTTKYQSYKSSSKSFVTANLRPTEIQSSLDRLKITYGRLHRRSSPWGPTTLA
jgi:hypothetical protein